jgi:hypothetical protein
VYWSFGPGKILTYMEYRVGRDLAMVDWLRLLLGEIKAV